MERTEESETQSSNDVGTARCSPVPNSSNPTITTDIIEDLEKIKGDSIGDTLYSSRFVLKTLIKLTNFTSSSTLEQDEDFEKDLCILWDMTIEKDVVQLLLEQNVLELFANIIQTNDEDKRLTEILVGIIGNMCALSETRTRLCFSVELMSPLLDLVSCTDSLILVQLMRLLHAALVFENSGDEISWFNHFKSAENFVEKLSFLLDNSMSTTLLVNAYEALNSICAKFAVIEIQPEGKDSSFSDLFVQPCLISGIVEAFKVMLPEQTDQSADDSLQPTKSSQRIMNLFLDINVILSQYSGLSEKSYQDCLPDVLKCISRILDPLCNPIYLFPVTTNEQGVIENINEIFQALGDPFHGKCFANLIRIRSMIDQHIDTSKTTQHSEWENDTQEEEIDLDDLNITILELLTRTCKNGSVDDIAEHVKSLKRENVVSLLDALKAGDSEPDIQESCSKLSAVIVKLWTGSSAS
ncbi:protein saal1 [Bradysia coprophila]|uniref:protein saal1 n=1 Tax=Bradysia coprophila TaxID=38358 RepID=UPI00187DACE2|nr:protein saal1 [Bradysia coprophila]